MNVLMQNLLLDYDERNYLIPDPPNEYLIPPACHRRYCTSPTERRHFDALIAKMIDDRLKEAKLKAVIIVARNFASCKKKNLCYYDILVQLRQTSALDVSTRLTQKDAIGQLFMKLLLSGVWDVALSGSSSILGSESEGVSLELMFPCPENRDTQTQFLPPTSYESYPRLLTVANVEENETEDEEENPVPKRQRTRRHSTPPAARPLSPHARRRQLRSHSVEDQLSSVEGNLIVSDTHENETEDEEPNPVPKQQRARRHSTPASSVSNEDQLSSAARYRECFVKLRRKI